MNRESSLESLVHLVLPLVTPAPRAIVVDALAAAAREFCEQAAVWRVVLEGELMPGEAEMPLCLPDGARLAHVLGVWLGGAKLEAGWEAHGASIFFARAAAQPLTGRVEAALRPTRTARHLPEDVLEAWGDEIAAGALARVQGMSGPKIEWTNPDAAAGARARFEAGVARARVTVWSARNAQGRA